MCLRLLSSIGKWNYFVQSSIPKKQNKYCLIKWVNRIQYLLKYFIFDLLCYKV